MLPANVYRKNLTSLRSAPNSDQKEQGQQRELEEDVEQHDIERAEGAVERAHQNEQGGIVLPLAIVDRRPGDQHGRKRQQRGQHDERQADPVEAQQELEVHDRIAIGRHILRLGFVRRLPDVVQPPVVKLHPRLHGRRLRRACGQRFVRCGQHDRTDQRGDGCRQAQPAGDAPRPMGNEQYDARNQRNHDRRDESGAQSLRHIRTIQT
jgi:hypothetical protein